MIHVPYNDSDTGDRLELLIGRVVRAWADLESSLVLFASALLGVDQFRARIVMGSFNSGRAQRQLVQVLAETYLDEALLPELRGFLRRMKTLGDQRNTLAHSMMHISGNENEHEVFRDRFDYGDHGGLAFAAELFPLNRVKMLYEAIRTLRKEMIFFMFRAEGKVHSSARIHREEAGDHKP